MLKKPVKTAALLLTISVLFTGCSGTDTSKKQSEKESAAQEKTIEVDVMALSGPTAMGMVQFMRDAQEGTIESYDYQFEIAASIDEVTPRLVKGEIDIAAVPANVASVLYNNTQKDIEVLAVNTLGVLYICETGDSIQTVSDLKGRTVYASGKGATPEYALNYILEKNNLVPGKDVTIEWKSEHAECVAAIAADPKGIAMLPQPFVTTAQSKNEQIRIALDLTKEWDSLQTGDEQSSMITGAVVARKDFIEEEPEAVENFLEHYDTSVAYINENIEEGAKLVGEYGIVPREIAEKAIPQCNIVFIDGNEMKERLSGYLQILYEQNAKAVGGAMPDDDFYYGAQ